MRGKSLRFAGVCGAGFALLVASGCARNVKGDANSGKDHREKGAKAIKLDGEETQVRDIVTYPGGDRVDWKVVELPEGKKGDLRIRLKWKPARPGMDLAFDVYDEFFERVERAKPASRVTKYSKNVKVRNASGKYFIQVYAPRRMDAGRYRLRVQFRERKQAPLPTADELANQIDDPPTLPAVIEPEVEKPKTPEEIAAEAEAKRLQDEQDAKARADADAQAAELAKLNKPVFAQIIKTQNQSDGTVLITLNKGTGQGVERGWNGIVLEGSGSKELAGGEFKLIRATRSESIGKVRLSADQLRRNKRVRLQRAQVE